MKPEDVRVVVMDLRDIIADMSKGRTIDPAVEIDAIIDVIPDLVGALEFAKEKGNMSWVLAIAVFTSAAMMRLAEQINVKTDIRESVNGVLMEYLKGRIK